MPGSRLVLTAQVSIDPQPSTSGGGPTGAGGWAQAAGASARAMPRQQRAKSLPPELEGVRPMPMLAAVPVADPGRGIRRHGVAQL